MDLRDLRSAERFVVAEPVMGNFGAAAVYVVNISEHGVQIEHGQQLRLGLRNRLWFRRGDISASVEGVVVWSYLSHTADSKGRFLYNSGVRIEATAVGESPWSIRDYTRAMKALIDRGLARREAGTLDRKRRRAVAREMSKRHSVETLVRRPHASSPGYLRDRGEQHDSEGGLVAPFQKW